MGLEVIDGTPTAISKYLREREVKMKEKYKEFADKFEKLCDEFASADFDAKELLEVCDNIIQNYSN